MTRPSPCGESPAVRQLRPAVIALVLGCPATMFAAGGPEGALRAGRAAGPSLPVRPFAEALPSPAADPEPDGPASRRWAVRTQDITLVHTLERWTAQAGYRLKWDAQRNFLIGAPDIYEGTFEAALQSVLSSSGIRQSDYPLEACIYANTPPLVRVTRQGEQARECVAP